MHLYAPGPPRDVHWLDELLAKVPDPPRRHAAATLKGLDLRAVSMWRQEGTYPADFPEVALEDLVFTAHALASAACALVRLAARHVAGAAPAVEAGTAPSEGSAAWEAERAALGCADIERAAAGWDFTRETPTAQMGIPEPPEPPGPGALQGVSG